MALFEFLMILMSLIIGLGLAQLLSGIAHTLKTVGVKGFYPTHSAAVLTIFFALLQTFWEIWGLKGIVVWSFHAMLLMLAGPILLFVIAYVLYPDDQSQTNLDEYYFDNIRVFWPLAAFTAFISTIFRPLAFEISLFTVDNLSAVPIMIICLILTFTKQRLVHHIGVWLIFFALCADTLIFSGTIQQ